MPRIRHLQQCLAQQQRSLERLQTAVEGVGREAVRATTHGMQLQQELFQVRERQQRVELTTPGPRPYSHAIRLVRGGARIEDLIAACGLSPAEAELIASIHKRAASAATDAKTSSRRKAKILR
jgi:hypothetical protein